ncbi:hypothetical protein PANT_24d00051 [Moesziomyces antarcticus T-34]|uniref:Mediator of RNA polymerase II transcription subunit 13 n=1 Tax=Pseudozyma antarctica (strain T-34) TaxID=1151754 RepID=M9M7M4_PSEA3|nr:hypothetical protein PANT_24d00051 [Moesziomyces antarcticus T-34]
MAHTPGAFAAHARSNSLANSPSAHRRAGAMAPVQHASSPSTTSASSRLHTNTPFPGTVAAPRSAMPPASASAHLRSMQYLSRLTERTPASFVKLPFPSNTTVHWLRLQKPDSHPPPELGQDHTQPDTAAPAGATSTSTNQSQGRDTVWTNAVHQILTNSKNVQAGSRNDDNTQTTPDDAFERLVRRTLVYTSALRPVTADSLDASTADSSIYASVSDLWLFAAVNDDDSGPPGKTSSAVGPTAAATTTNAAQTQGIAQSAGVDDVILNAAHQQTTPTNPTVSSLPAVARWLPSESVKALARLFESATVDGGSYLLSSACPSSRDNKGKQSVLTSQQNQAHRHFMETLKTRASSIFAQESLPPFSSSPAGELGTSTSSTSSPTLRRRLRLGDSVIFLPPAADIAALPSQVHGKSASSPRPGAPTVSTDLYCLAAELHLSLCRSSLLLRTTSRRLAALPLASTPRGQHEAPPLLHEARPQLHLAPLGQRAELIHVVSSDSIASDHLSQLRTLFASLDLGSGNGMGIQPVEVDLLASGIAVCALPPALAEAHASAGDASHPLEQTHEASFAAYPHIQAIDDDMGLDLLDAPGFGEQTQRPQQRSSEDRRFLWPVSLCLVALDPRRAAWSSSWPGASATNDLHTIRSEPVTPLKELVSFTLKVLNDANESVAAQSAPPFTPGEPDDVSLTRHRGERISSARPGITPASMSFADFDLAMPSAASVTPSQSLPTVPRTDSQTSPEKREHAGAEAGPSTNSADQQFADDLSWMEFLPQATGEVPGAAASAAAMPASSVPIGSAPTAVPPASSTVPAAQAAGQVKGLDLDPSGSNWAFATSLDAGGDNVNHLEAKQDPASLAAQALLQPQGRLHSSGSTPFQGQAATPLSFGQTQTKRKGEGDIFGNLGLLTEDDFSFFDESAFGLESPSALAGEQGAMSSHLDPSGVSQADVSANATAHQHGLGRGETSARDPSGGAAAQATSMSATSAGIGDVEMEDLEATNLDALFGAIPSMQDVMGAESSQMRASEPPPHSAVSAAAAPSQIVASAAAHDTAGATAASSSQAMPPVTVSFTPRSVSAATPFGDPASLPGFTPSSLTESSPAFGHANHKTPRTPFSPVEEYRDGAAIVGSEAGNHHAGESAQLDGRYAHLAPQDQAGFPAAAGSKLESQEEGGQLRLADASSAAAAAANAAMSTDPFNKKRPAIVPSAFLPLTQPQARKPLQRLTMGARANLGRKYDLFGKFASRPKSTAVLHALPNAANALSPDQNVQDEGKGDSASFSSRFALRPSRASPPKAVARRGQALLQLRRDRNSKMSPGQAVTTGGRHGGQRGLDAASTPRSSDDIAIARRASVSDSDSSSSEDDDEASDDAHSDSDVTEVTLSPEDQESMKRCSRHIIASYLCGAYGTSSEGEATGSHQPAALLNPATTSSPMLWPGSAAIASSTYPTIKRSMLSRTARWLLENPQFRSMYSRAVDAGSDGSDIATREKLEVLAAMACALRITHGSETKPSTQSSTHSDGFLEQEALPTLQGLVVNAASSRAIQATEGNVVQAEVLEPTSIAVGCQGSVVEALPSALSLWDKSKLSAVSGHKHVVAKVLLTHASPAWHDEIVAWLERLRAAFEAYGLGTHTGSAGSILVMADGSEPLALSSYLERLWRDGDAWLDTLRSIASRVDMDVLQGRHVVIYALQPPGSTTCAASGFRGLLQLEADLRVMLAEQVGVLAEHLIVRPISPAMMTESGSLGFGQQSDAIRRLAFSVYDQLPRLVRRQPAKVLHGREPGPISAIVQFPAFSLATGLGRTNFSLSWPREPTTAVDEALMLHVSYRACADGAAKMVVVSAMDERGGSSDVDVLVGDAEGWIGQVWRYAIGQASRARLSWRLVISSTVPMSRQEQAGWHSCVEAYFTRTQGGKLAVGSVVLLCVRPDEAGAILADVGARTRPSTEPGQVDKSRSVLMDASDCSQVLQFTEPLPLDWTMPFASPEEMASSTASAILVHRPSSAGGRDMASHVLGVDVLQTWREKEAVMADVLASLHALRLVAEQRHQITAPPGLPWGIAAVNMLAQLIGRAVVVD